MINLLEPRGALAANERQQFITIHYEGKDRETVQIPIRIEPPELPITVFPKALTIVGADGSTELTRTVVVRRKAGWPQPPQVTFPDRLCDVTFQKPNDRGEIVAVVRIGGDAIGKTFDIQIAALPNELVKLPVKVLP